VVAPAVPLVEASAGQGEGAVPTFAVPSFEVDALFAVPSRAVDAIGTTSSPESPRSEDNPTMSSSKSEWVVQLAVSPPPTSAPPPAVATGTPLVSTAPRAAASSTRRFLLCRFYPVTSWNWSAGMLFPLAGEVAQWVRTKLWTCWMITGPGLHCI